MDKSNALEFESRSERDERANISICTIEKESTPMASDLPDRFGRETVKNK